MGLFGHHVTVSMPVEPGVRPVFVRVMTKFPPGGSRGKRIGAGSIGGGSTGHEPVRVNVTFATAGEPLAEQLVTLPETPTGTGLEFAVKLTVPGR